MRAPAAGADDPYQGRGPGSRQHQHRVHPDGTGALKKRSAVHWQVPGRVERQASNGCRGCPNSCSLRALLRQRSRCPERAAAPEAAGPAIEPPGTGHEARQLAVDLGFTPLAPPKSSRTAYRSPGIRPGNIQAARVLRVFSRFDRLDVMFPGFIVFALFVDAPRSLNPPQSFPSTVHRIFMTLKLLWIR